jgi:hypothetical protein
LEGNDDGTAKLPVPSSASNPAHGLLSVFQVCWRFGDDDGDDDQEPGTLFEAELQVCATTKMAGASYWMSSLGGGDKLLACVDNCIELYGGSPQATSNHTSKVPKATQTTSSLYLLSRVQTGAACITCMSVSHEFVAIAEMQRSIQIYRYDDASQSLVLICKEAAVSRLVSSLHLCTTLGASIDPRPHGAVAEEQSQSLRLLAHDVSNCAFLAMELSVPALFGPNGQKQSPVLKPSFHLSMPVAVTKIIGPPSHGMGFADALFLTSLGTVGMAKWTNSIAGMPTPNRGSSHEGLESEGHWGEMEQSVYLSLQSFAIGRGTQDEHLGKNKLQECVCTTLIENMIRINMCPGHRKLTRGRSGKKEDGAGSEKTAAWLETVLLSRVRFA